ncbi:hypothetical protein HDU76_013427 [Blyttiomyces sp. JEL0837]|nr:hypothetical protein HDU76_013427 [Blyttiomyces sp. JEL0837]
MGSKANSMALLNAAKMGHLEVVKYLCECASRSQNSNINNTWAWSDMELELAFLTAVNYGFLAIAKYLHDEKGVDYPDDLTVYVATKGRLDLIQIEVIQWPEPNTPIPRTSFLSLIKNCDGALILLTDKIDEQVLKEAGPQLKVISTMSVGYDHINLQACRNVRPGLKIGITPDVLTDCTAELTVGLLLATARRFPEAMKAVTNGEWGIWQPTWLCGMGISQKTIGIIGLGRIGIAVAERLKPFKPSKIQYTSPRRKTQDIEGIEYISDLNEFLASSDIVIITCQLSDETRWLINEKTLGMMKRDAILINTARGGIVKQDDLYNALKNNIIRAAGLDVTDPEPIPSNHPLTTLPNCLILPHIGSATMETREAMASLAVDNVIAGVLGGKMPAALDY